MNDADAITELLSDWLVAWRDGRDERNVYQRTLEVLHGRIPEIDDAPSSPDTGANQ
jgi:hypothetical protein